MADTDPHSPPPHPSSRYRGVTRGRMSLLFMVMLVTAAGNTAMQSVMPSIGTELGVEDFWISLAYSWSALLWVICAPIWARRSDRRGRKSMMAVGLVGFILSMALCGMVLIFGLAGFLSAGMTLVFFAAARSLYGGFGSAAPPAVQAYVASRTPRSERTQALALIASSFGLGTVIGPALAPLLIFPQTGLVGPFFAFALVAIIVLFALRLRLPDDTPTFAARGDVVSEPFSAGANARLRDDDDTDENSDVDLGDGAKGHFDPAHNNGTPPNQRNGGDNNAKIASSQGRQGIEGDRLIPDLSWRDRRLRPWVIAGLLGGHAQAAMLGISGFFILDRLMLRTDPAAGTGPIGLVLMSGAIATLLAQWGLIPMLKLGPRASTMWGMALGVIGIIIFSLAYDLHMIALGFSIASLGFGLYRPGFTAGASLAVTRMEQGQVGGIVASINGACYILAPAAGVWLYGHHPSIGFATIGLLCAIVFTLCWRNMEPDEVLTSARR